MVISVNGRGLPLFGESLMDTLKTAVVKNITSAVTDKGTKATVSAQAIRMVTGVEPIVDAKDPAVTWVRMRPEHGEILDALLFKAPKKVAGGPSKGKAADFKIDVLPALKPIFFRRLLPKLLAIFAVGAVIGYAVGKR